MCGISGFIGSNRNLCELIKAMNDRISHRGPDGEGIWIGKGIALGHRRLAILDVSDSGTQPMSYADGRYWIVYNGEVYNFLELRQELESKGYNFRSKTDTEVILAAYVEWGKDCMLKFNGMWAFAIWDDKNKELFLSRDRFGVKPLFYYQQYDTFAFSSEMKGLFPIIDEIKINYSVVEKARQNVFSYESTEECLIEGIQRFPAGSYGIVKDNQLRIYKWWHTLDHLPEIPRRYEEQVEQMREVFLDACRIRMRSDVPIGTCLSGGLDSSAVICTIKHLVQQGKHERQSPDWQHAFVATFPGSAIDERRYAEKVVDYTEVQAEFLNIDPIGIIDDIDEMLYMFEEIYLTSPIPFMITYKKVREKGVVVTLDGHGADELYGGYPSSPVTAVQDAGVNLKTIANLYFTYVNCFQDALNQSGGNKRLTKNFIFSSLRQYAKRVLDYPIFPAEDHPKWKEMDFLGRGLYFETHRSILPTLLRNYDRYSMANGVEIRMPFMDWRIVTLAFALPARSKVGAGYTKRIIRDAISPYMPHDIAYRKTKIGFNSPVVEWFQGSLRSWLLDTLNSSDFVESSIVNGKLISKEGQTVLNSHNMQWADAERLWTQITPYLWERAMVKHRSANL